jgi:hypothetical protein
MEAVFEVLHGPFCAQGKTYQQGDTFAVKMNAAQPYFDCIMRGPQSIKINHAFDDPLVQILSVLFFPITLLLIFYYALFEKESIINYDPVPIRLIGHTDRS